MLGGELDVLDGSLRGVGNEDINWEVVSVCLLLNQGLGGDYLESVDRGEQGFRALVFVGLVEEDLESFWKSYFFVLGGSFIQGGGFRNYLGLLKYRRWVRLQWFGVGFKNCISDKLLGDVIFVVVGVQTVF